MYGWFDDRKIWNEKSFIFYVCKDSSVLIVFKIEKKIVCKSKILVEFYFKCYVL